LTLQDDATTAVAQKDGTALPRLLVTWVEPVDVYVQNGGTIQIQWQDTDGVFVSGNWVDAGSVSGTATHFFISGVTGVSNVAVQIRSVRSNGNASAWVQQTISFAGAHTLNNVYQLTPQFDLTQSAISTISMGTCSVTFNTNNTVNYSARTFAITTPVVDTWYYVCITDPSQVGETSATLTATCTTTDTNVGLLGMTFVGAVQVVAAGGGTNMIAGGWPNPLTVITNLPGTGFPRPHPSVPHHIGPTT
jgi:hypothetical protein